jgi:uncharacterized protein with von Willebrand factor type A (vWA) domain
MYPFGSLPANLAAFCDVLRRAYRVRVGPGELRDAARALELVDLSDQRTVRNVLRPILSATFDDAAVFDDAFTRFFRLPSGDARTDDLNPADPETSAAIPSAAPGPSQTSRSTVPAPSAPSEEVSDDQGETFAREATPVATSDGEPEITGALVRSRVSPFEVETTEAPWLVPADVEWTDAARALVRQVRRGLSRRWRPGRKGRRFDLRRTLRSSLQTGGEAVTPRWLRRRMRPPRFVVLVDGSRSMSLYTQAALRLAVAMASATARVEVFTFSTSLQSITSTARKAAAGESRQVEGLRYSWGGGTSIGASVRAFLEIHGERLLGRETVVIIVSDGLDAGDPAALGDALSELRRRSASLVWLNPLLDTAGYEPTAAGMSAARSHITTFTSVNEPQDLARLARSIRVR